jgi:ABC-type sugar transport system substrate-binding protein
MACALIALAVALSGCGGPGDSAHRVKLAGIIFQEDQFFRLSLLGMREAAVASGARLLEANSDNKPDREIELVRTYVGQKVDAILMTPLSAKGSVAALKFARANGVAVILHNTSVEDESVYAASIESDHRDLGAQTGRAAARYIRDKLGGKAKAAIVAYKSLLPEQSEARTSGFKSEIGGMTGVEVVAEQDAWLAENAFTVVTDILTAHPDVDVVWAANEGGTVGAVLAVKKANKAGQVAVFGTDASEQLAAFLLAPDASLQAVTGQQPFTIGVRAVETALKVLRKEPVDKRVRLNGIHLSRDDPDGVRTFQKQLQAWIRGRK